MPNQSTIIIGAVNIDIGGRPNESLRPCDSNPGKVHYTLGGVGRNIAHNLALLKDKVSFIGALGDDPWAKQILQSCKTLGIDTIHCPHIPNQSTSTYLFIVDEKGEMQLAVSDMDITKNITPELILDKLPIINKQGLCIMDANLPKESLLTLAKNATCPIFVDPVSTQKAEKLIDCLPFLHSIKPNLLEIACLTDVTITDDDSILTAVKKLLNMGVQQVFLSMGAKGMICANKNEIHHLPNYVGKNINTTGCGDASMAGIAYAFSLGYSLKKQAQYGLAAASVCLESENTVNAQLCANTLNHIVKGECK